MLCDFVPASDLSVPGALLQEYPCRAHQRCCPSLAIHLPAHCRHLLGIGLLHQSTPELISGIGVAVDELVVDGGQPVVDDHIYPLPKAPEVEVEDARIGIRLLRVPLLLLPVWDDLDEGNRMRTH